MLSEGKIGKYIKYAIGEIVLVVIGILIALQINAWNDQRQNKKKVEILLKKIQKDIETDISEIKSKIPVYATSDSLISLVLNDKLTVKDYRKSNSLRLHNLILAVNKINLKNNSYKNLIAIQDIIPPEYEDIMDQLNLLYEEHFNDVQSQGEIFISKMYSFHDDLFENYDWYSLGAIPYQDAERIDYLLNNVKYKGMVRQYRLFGINNYLSTSLQYSEEAIRAHNLINDVLSPDQKSKPIQAHIDQNSKYLGTYKLINGSISKYFLQKNVPYISIGRDTFFVFNYEKGRYMISDGFGRIEKNGDNINVYYSNFANASIPFATKIEAIND